MWQLDSGTDMMAGEQRRGKKTIHIKKSNKNLENEMQDQAPLQRQVSHLIKANENNSNQIRRGTVLFSSKNKEKTVQ